jgi:hypothetical protein
LALPIESAWSGFSHYLHPNASTDACLGEIIGLRRCFLLCDWSSERIGDMNVRRTHATLCRLLRKRLSEQFTGSVAEPDNGNCTHANTRSRKRKQENPSAVIGKVKFSIIGLSTL